MVRSLVGKQVCAGFAWPAASLNCVANSKVLRGGDRRYGFSQPPGMPARPRRAAAYHEFLDSRVA